MDIKLKTNSLYLGDNGRITCGKHCGATAQATGRDLYGAEMLEVDKDMAVQWFEDVGSPISCETCGLVAEWRYYSVNCAASADAPNWTKLECVTKATPCAKYGGWRLETTDRAALESALDADPNVFEYQEELSDAEFAMVQSGPIRP